MFSKLFHGIKAAYDTRLLFKRFYVICKMPESQRMKWFTDNLKIALDVSKGLAAVAGFFAAAIAIRNPHAFTQSGEVIACQVGLLVATFTVQTMVALYWASTWNAPSTRAASFIISFVTYVLLLLGSCAIASNHLP